MGRRNYLIEGGSGTGKTTVGEELTRRGYRVVHGDRALAYQGDPSTGGPVEVAGVAVHHHHIWKVERVKKLIADEQDEVMFFCGSSRNVENFIDLFDEVFVLEIDIGTLTRRPQERQAGEWGGQGRLAERDLILELHRSRVEVPRRRIAIDAGGPLTQVVDQILKKSLGISGPQAGASRRG